MSKLKTRPRKKAKTRPVGRPRGGRRSRGYAKFQALVPPELFRRIKIAAAAAGKPLSEIGEEALAAWLKARRLGGLTGVGPFMEGLDRMYGRAMRNLAKGG
ncbi:MAG TPA: hypothetical protein VFI25_06090 [Planctomycetota bacterium]|jgi:hypothetical protein|nr:hypothetical protein [Planctomycetota bacterium]